MNEPKNVSPRARLQELLAIPDSHRSDAEWDELNELEIMFAPGNRVGGPEYGARQGGGGSGGGGSNAARRRKPGGGQPQPRPQQPAAALASGGGNGNGNAAEAGGARKPARKFRKKAPRAKPPQEG